MLTDFNHAINIWINALEHYSFSELCAKPAPNSWSLGQVYIHLIDDTNYYLEQIRLCTSANDNAMEEAAPFAKKMFVTNEFPDERIEGAPTNINMPQPLSKEDLRISLMNLKEALYQADILINTSPSNGKTKHPGLDYFSAKEWFQFSDMHFRHHLRQKNRIDNFLKNEFQNAL